MKKSSALFFSLVFYFMASAQSVGINTTTPDSSAALDIVSATKGFLMPRMNTTQMMAIPWPAAGLAVFNNDSSTVCIYTGTAWRKIILGVATGDNLGNHTATQNINLGFKYLTNGAGNWGLTIDTTGHASFISNAGGLAQVTINDNAASNARLKLKATGREWNLNGNNGQFYIHEGISDRQAFTIDNPTDDNILFIKGEKVGVGLSTLSAKLHVRANYNDLLKLEGGSTSGTWLKLTNTSGIENTFSFVATGMANSEGFQKLLINAPNAQLAIDADGRLGIGNTSPSQKLDVSGKTRTTDFQMTNGATNGYVLQSSADGSASWVNPATLANGNWTTSGSNQYSAVSGNVGIGNNSPEAKLHLKSNAEEVMKVEGSAATGTWLKLSNTSDGNNTFSFIATGTANSEGTQKLLINGPSGQTVLDGSGNLGLGFTSPSAKLDVNGRIRTSDFQLTNGATNGYVLQSSADGTGSWVNPSTLSSVSWTISGNNQYSSVSGNVGIGTASPGARLHASAASGTTILSEATAGNAYVEVRAPSGNEAAARMTTGGSTRWQIGKGVGAESGSNTGSDFFINRYDDAGSFSGQPLVIKRATGYVGINQGSPSAQLHINGSGAQTAAYNAVTINNIATSSTASINKVALEVRGTGGWNGGSAANIGLYVSSVTGGTNNYDAIFNGGGNVGVGTSAPSAKLEVSGITKTTGLQLTGGAANGYLLQSDAAGNGTWVNPSAIKTDTMTLIADADANTKVETQQAANENYIRFTLNGTEYYKMNKATLEVNNSGKCVYMGHAAGSNDLYTTIGADNENTGIGCNSLQNMVSGGGNAAIGVRSLQNASSGYSNTGAGAQAGKTITTGFENTFLGFNADATTGGLSNATAIGANASVSASNSLVLGNNVNVGIGLTAPATLLDISGNQSGSNSLQLRSGNAGSGTSSNQVLFGYNGTTSYRHAIKTRHNSSGTANNAIDFYLWDHSTDASAAVGSLAVMSITGNGRVGVNNTSPTYALDVKDSVTGSSGFVARIRNMGNVSTTWNHVLIVQGGSNSFGSSLSNFIAFVRPDNTAIGGITQNTASSVSYTTTSDERLKENIRNTQYGLNSLMNIQVKDYTYKGSAEQPQTGFIAQQLYTVYPGAVQPGGADAKTQPWVVDYSRLTPLLVQSVQDQQKIILAQQNKLDALERRVQELYSMLEKLK